MFAGGARRKLHLRLELRLRHERKVSDLRQLTFEDLKDERDGVIKASLNRRHIPVGMEMCNAADEEQWAVITRTIDQCDHYVVIVAHRYGSTTSEGISFTERKYDCAVGQGVPVLGFVIADKDVTWPPEWVDKERRAARLLNAFRQR